MSIQSSPFLSHCFPLLLSSNANVYIALTNLNNALNKIHERALRLIYNDHEKSFNSISTEKQSKTLKLLAIEIANFKMPYLRRS